jgi:hypothetical protein
MPATNGTVVSAAHVIVFGVVRTFMVQGCPGNPKSPQVESEGQAVELIRSSLPLMSIVVFELIILTSFGLITSLVAVT